MLNNNNNNNTMSVDDGVVVTHNNNNNNNINNDNDSNNRVIISPSILACDLSNLASEVIRIRAETGLHWVHVDVMDGYVP